jgi:hypothetical protein
MAQSLKSPTQTPPAILPRFNNQTKACSDGPDPDTYPDLSVPSAASRLLDLRLVASRVQNRGPLNLRGE